MSSACSVESSLAQYRELCARLDEKFAEIRQRHPEHCACRAGCHSCCAPGLTVNRLEAEHIKAFFRGNPTLAEEAAALAEADPHQGKRCSFLRANGECLIYPARPLVCRSHGAPIQLRPESSRDENLRVRDVCPLNFRGEELTKLRPESVLNVDTVNVLLALLAKRAYPGDDRRFPLALRALRISEGLLALLR